MSKQAGKSTDRVSARERARLAKATLDVERASREKLIEDAATAFYTAADQRDAALVKVNDAETAMGNAINSLEAQDETVARIATLTGLPAREVRRLRKLTTTTGDNEPNDPVQMSA